MHGTNNQLSTRKAPLPPGITTSEHIDAVTLPQHSANDTGYPSEIFGKLPVGFNLKDQHISALLHWHRKAMRAVADLSPGYTDADMTAAMAIANEIFEAIKLAPAKTSGTVADQMVAVVERLRFMGNDTSIEEELSVPEFNRFAEALAKSTAMPAVTKRVGPLQRGRKLTRAGLLHRYHAFLIGEIQTLSLNLYGSRDYAMRMQPLDDAVQDRVAGAFRDGKYNPKARRYPFFDESKLTVRARSVLKSLKIDTERSERRPANRYK
jgi:hypothetical protein